jgi:hypothetical protein
MSMDYLVHYSVGGKRKLKPFATEAEALRFAKARSSPTGFARVTHKRQGTALALTMVADFRDGERW